MSCRGNRATIFSLAMRAMIACSGKKAMMNCLVAMAMTGYVVIMAPISLMAAPATTFWSATRMGRSAGPVETMCLLVELATIRSWVAGGRTPMSMVLAMEPTPLLTREGKEIGWCLVLGLALTD